MLDVVEKMAVISQGAVARLSIKEDEDGDAAHCLSNSLSQQPNQPS